jgi:drug/metabolite transporter (DMT)-like permease
MPDARGGGGAPRASQRIGTFATGSLRLPLLLPFTAPRAAIPLAGVARADDPLRGIVLVIAATVFFSLSDATAKYVSETLPVIEVAWVRYVVFVVLTLLPAVRNGRATLYSRRPVTQVVRGVAIVASAVFFLFGLRVLPMADAAAINFVSPLFITILSVPVLGERVGWRRWVAVGVGLCGAVIAAQPGSSAFQTAAILPVLSSLAWALGIVLTRRMANTESAATTLAWSAASGLAVLTCLLPFEARVPSLREFGFCLLVGLFASSGQWLVVLGYRTAPASLLAPFSYLQLIWSTLLGYLVFDGRPGLATIIGASVIAGSGLYSAQRERARAREG